MSLPQADPAARELDAAFAEAMGAQPRPKEPPAPPETDRDAPHGRAEDGTPLAPYGLTRAGQPKLSPAGRKPKDRDEQPRLAKEDPGPKTGTVLEPRDYTEGLSGTADALWLVLTMGAKLPLAKLRLGKWRPVPEDASLKLAVEATLLREQTPLLVQGMNVAAAHSPAARRLADKLDLGDGTWMLTCVSLFGPFFLQTAAVWTGKVDPAVIREYADRNKADLAEFTEQIKDHIRQVQEAAAAAAAPGPPQEAKAA